MALREVALAGDHAKHDSEAEAWSHRQIEACTRAGDPIFIANGKYGVGKMAAAQGHHAEALKWGREALAEFEAVGFAVGPYSARLVIAESLIATNQQLDQAQAMLDDTLQYYREQKSDLANAETEGLLARLAEKRGDLPAALPHTKQVIRISQAAEVVSRERRLAYLQVQFDTPLNEQLTALLVAEQRVAALPVTAPNRWPLPLAVRSVSLSPTAFLTAA